MSLRRLKEVSLIQVPVKMSLRYAKLVSLTQVPVGTSLKHLRLVCFIHVPGRRHKYIANRSAELTYQLRQVMMRPQHGTRRFVLCSTIFRHVRWFSLFKVPASTLIQLFKDVGLIQVPVVTLRRVKLVSLSQVSIGMQLRRLKFANLIYVPVCTSKTRYCVKHKFVNPPITLLT